MYPSPFQDLRDQTISSNRMSAMTHLPISFDQHHHITLLNNILQHISFIRNSQAYNQTLNMHTHTKPRALIKRPSKFLEGGCPVQQKLDRAEIQKAGHLHLQVC
jgi:hypothetical protein